MTEKASLVWAFRQQDGRPPEILLIHKKRGLGVGKVNAPGGRLETGESWPDAAARELKEETGTLVSAETLVEVADLSFRFLDGYELEVKAYFAGEPLGDPMETEEAAPFWCPVDSIPWQNMWKDDALWLPPCLAGKRVEAHFVFNEDAMLEADVRVHERPMTPISG
ncbi:MAG: NUDIX domain-containing protein [Spirochaetales bacterium]